VGHRQGQKGRTHPAALATPEPTVWGPGKFTGWTPASNPRGCLKVDLGYLGYF
jgi:hypothetical protein